MDINAAKNLYPAITRSLAMFGIKLKEVTSDLGLSAIIQSQSDDDNSRQNSGYFYVEIPMRNSSAKRLIFVRDENRPNQPFVPLQLGREIAALCMNMDPSKSQWKACVLEKDKETEVAKAFRTSFGKFCDTELS